MQRRCCGQFIYPTERNNGLVTKILLVIRFLYMKVLFDYSDSKQYVFSLVQNRSSNPWIPTAYIGMA